MKQDKWWVDTIIYIVAGMTGFWLSNTISPGLNILSFVIFVMTIIVVLAVLVLLASKFIKGYNSIWRNK